MAKVQLILEDRYVNKKGLYTIKLSLSHLSKTVLMKTDYKIAKEDWNEAKEEIKAKCKRYNAQKANDLLHDMQKDLRGFLEDLNVEKSLSSYTVGELVKMYEEKRKVSSSDDIEVLFNLYISEKKSMNPDAGTAGLYKNTLRLLMKYCENKKTKISSVTPAFLVSFEGFLRDKEKNKVNGIAMNMRNLRAVCNYAIKLRIIDYNNYPFRSYTIKHDPTNHRNIAIIDLVRIWRYQGTVADNNALNLFKLSFYLRGMNFKDILHAKKDNIYNDHLIYKRAKTNKELRIKIEPEAKAIIKKYQGSEYLLKFIEQKQFRAKPDRKTPLHKDITRNVNRRLKDIMEREEIKIPISTYYARHTWATLAREIEIAYDIISAALGHGMRDVTSTYVKIEDKVVDAANRTLIDFLNENLKTLPVVQQKTIIPVKKSKKKKRRTLAKNQ